ncbi:MAG: serine hydrolase [Bacteroidia bacterium]|nr:serine hydrolase [Bacteroidia bacterium]
MNKFKNLILFQSILLIIIFFPSCRKQEENDRFPLADQYNINGEQLTAAFDEMRTVEGALSLIVCREGTIVAEEYTNYKTYGADSIKNIMSVTKTFTGVLVGLAIEKGFIESVNDPISKYLTGIVTFPDNIKPNITIDQLLKMSFGHSWNGTSEASLFEECFFDSEDNLQYIIDLPLVSTPGAVFNYSDGASHLLSVIITEASGMNTLDFAKENLFDPLGITKFTWATDNRGYPLGAAYLRITPADMVKFGNLILNKGKYDSKQIVPESWINTMTTTKISTNNDVLYGPEYGYQIWLGSASGHRYYMAMGWGGQFIFIVPDQDLVVTATCWTSDITYQQAGEQWVSIIRIIVEQIFPAVN